MAQWLKTNAALKEDPSLSGDSQLHVIPTPRGSDVSGLYSQNKYTYPHTEKHTELKCFVPVCSCYCKQSGQGFELEDRTLPLRIPPTHIITKCYALHQHNRQIIFSNYVHMFMSVCGYTLS